MKILCGLLLFLSQYAFATADFRMSLGHSFGAAKSLNENVPEKLQLTGLNILGFDFIANPVAMNGIGGGLRFDNFNRNQKDTAGEYSYKAAVLTALINYRVINSNVYAGPIVGLGVTHSTELEAKIVNGANGNYVGKKNKSWSIGGEGGVHLGHLALGGELGWLHLKAKELEDSSGGFLLSDTGNKKNANFSGLYFRAQLGIRF